MGRLSDPQSIEREFHRVLEAEKLDDLSQFYRDGVFEEIPLYSRDSQLAFLDRRNGESANAVVFRLGLEYLERLIGHQEPTARMFAALTFNDYSKRPFLQPNIFVCTGRVDEQLKGRLILRAPISVFAGRMRSTLGEVSDPGRYDILQDTLTVRRKARVFIGPGRMTYPLMVGVREFEAARKPRNGRLMHGATLAD